MGSKDNPFCRVLTPKRPAPECDKLKPKLHKLTQAEIAARSSKRDQVVGTGKGLEVMDALIKKYGHDKPPSGDGVKKKHAISSCFTVEPKQMFSDIYMERMTRYNEHLATAKDIDVQADRRFFEEMERRTGAKEKKQESVSRVEQGMGTVTVGDMEKTDPKLSEAMEISDTVESDRTEDLENDYVEEAPDVSNLPDDFGNDFVADDDSIDNNIVEEVEGDMEIDADNNCVTSLGQDAFTSDMVLDDLIEGTIAECDNNSAGVAEAAESIPLAAGIETSHALAVEAIKEAYNNALARAELDRDKKRSLEVEKLQSDLEKCKATFAKAEAAIMKDLDESLSSVTLEEDKNEYRGIFRDRLEVEKTCYEEDRVPVQARFDSNVKKIENAYQKAKDDAQAKYDADMKAEEAAHAERKEKAERLRKEEEERRLKEEEMRQKEEEQRQKEAEAQRLKEEKERQLQEEKEQQLKAEKERHLKEEKERRLKEEKERRLKEEKERRLKEEKEQRLKEEKERRLKEEKERRLKEEKEQRLKEERERRLKEEKEKQLKAEKEQQLKEETERRLQEEKERRLKEEKERQLKEEKERQMKEEKEKRLKEEETQRLQEEEKQRKMLASLREEERRQKLEKMRKEEALQKKREEEIGEREIKSEEEESWKREEEEVKLMQAKQLEERQRKEEEKRKQSEKGKEASRMKATAGKMHLTLTEARPAKEKQVKEDKAISEQSRGKKGGLVMGQYELSDLADMETLPSSSPVRSLPKSSPLPSLPSTSPVSSIASTSPVSSIASDNTCLMVDLGSQKESDDTECQRLDDVTPPLQEEPETAVADEADGSSGPSAVVQLPTIHIAKVVTHILCMRSVLAQLPPAGDDLSECLQLMLDCQDELVTKAKALQAHLKVFQGAGIGLNVVAKRLMKHITGKIKVKDVKTLLNEISAVENITCDSISVPQNRVLHGKFEEAKDAACATDTESTGTQHYFMDLFSKIVTLTDREPLEEDP